MSTMHPECPWGCHKTWTAYVESYVTRIILGQARTHSPQTDYSAKFTCPSCHRGVAVDVQFEPRFVCMREKS
jgi:hypothetical protein